MMSRLGPGLIGLGLMVALGQPAFAYLPPAYGGSLSAPLPGRWVTLDPALASRAAELQIIHLLYDTLFVLSDENQARPHLAASDPEVSEEGLRWVIALRPDIALWTGRPLRAAQVAASLRRVQSGPSAYLLAPVRSIRALGPASLELRLHRPCPELTLLLSAPATAIAVPREGKLQGTGPFRLHEVSGSHVLLKAFARHFAGRPYLDDLRLMVFDRPAAEMAAFQAGALQLSQQGPSLFGGPTPMAVRTLASTGNSLLALLPGKERPYLKDAQVRQALLMALDRGRLGRLEGSGARSVAGSPLLKPPPPLREVRPLPYSRDAARRLLQRAAARLPALRRDLDGGRLKLDILVDKSQAPDLLLAGQIVADLDGIGVAATVAVKDPAEYQARLEAGRFDLLLGRATVQAPFPAATLAGALALAGEPDQARRCLLTSSGAARAFNQFTRYLPLLPLLHSAPRLFHDARIGGLAQDPLGRIRFDQVHWLRGQP